ncbi:MAG: DUF2007 domain-containing protein [Sedimentisphaerales bacterium]|nr:DUF2007 domain-containing protein [Sedimentisphaerales bacterium]
MDADELVPIYWPQDYLEASSIKQALEEKGIACHIDGENLSSLSGSGPFGSAGRWKMQLMVRSRDAQRSQELIESSDWPHYT